jgi:predicted transcriptional regulator
MKNIRKKRNTIKRGRPATGQDPVTAIRLSPDLRAAVDRWAARQAGKPSRSQAIRQLIEHGLASTRPASRASKAASKASAMAGREIDRIEDKSASGEERERRKRRLTKGPAEFREMRGDLPEKD